MLNTLKQIWQNLTPLDKRRLILVLAFMMSMTLFEYAIVIIFLIGLITEQINIWMYKDHKYRFLC